MSCAKTAATANLAPLTIKCKYQGRSQLDCSRINYSSACIGREGGSMYRTTCTLWLMYTLFSFTSAIQTNAFDGSYGPARAPPSHIGIRFWTQSSPPQTPPPTPPPHLTVVRGSFNLQGRGQHSNNNLKRGNKKRHCVFSLERLSFSSSDQWRGALGSVRSQYAAPVER